MLHPFISSASARTTSLGGVWLSALAHAAVIAGAVAGSGRTPPRPAESSAGEVERVSFVEVRPVTRAALRAAPERRAVPGERALSIPTLALAVGDITVPDVPPEIVPDANVVAETTDWVQRQFTGATMSDLIGAMFRRLYTAPAGGAYTEDLVEKIAWPRVDNPRPVYPASMMAAGIEESFFVKFVVDSTGRVDEQSLSFPESAHRLFVDAVKRVLLRSRYYPAELAGRRVRQLVQQVFVFRIAR
jgi:hypothetical protein